jgi:hypothetical protein
LLHIEANVDVWQALLTGFDTALSKQFHEEGRAWREEDRLGTFNLV